MNIYNNSKPIFFTLILTLLLALNVKAQVVYENKNAVVTIGKQIEYYIDSTSSQTIQSVQQLQHFKKSTAAVPDLGLLKVPVWLKIQITNRSDVKSLMMAFDQSLLESIDFYTPVKGAYNVSSGGEMFPFRARAISYHKFIYNLNIPKDSTYTYYTRIMCTHQMQLPIFLGDKDHMEESNLSKNIFFGIFFGIILVMFFYNLFVFFSVKDNIYLYYVLYILVVGLLQATIEGYGFQYLWPNSSYLAMRTFFLLTALVNISGLEFVRKFLHTKEFTPKLDKISYGLYTVYAIAILLTLKGNFYISYQILQSFAGLVSIYMLVLSVTIARQGNRAAKFFIFAWIPLILCIIIWILKDVSVLPYTVFTNYSITFGSALEVILLSFALADKINIFKAEKEKSQEETVKALQENERIIREQNVILEAKVEERTHELSETNEELNITLEDLKQAQSQLVESEKMASLGQLTAGIAHEINNPINFVTSNVNPLKRDVDMILDALTVIEEIGASDSSATEKQKKIQDYKEELDFDYLIVEIRHLIKGINEGANRTAEIVKGLKIFSRLDEDDLKKTDINEGVESTMVIANNLLNNKITVVKEYDENLPLAECYAGKLNQVFLNIISNAVYAIQKQFGDEQGGQLLLRTTHDADNIYITIKDNGTGMDEQTQKKMFEPFFTTKDVGEGTGLGMSITYNTIKKHNGQIIVNSKLGEGTEFILQIPIIFNVKAT